MASLTAAFGGAWSEASTTQGTPSSSTTPWPGP
uniref:GUN10 n=1 Tax=Arundo donax TaxID=35708 RepID=A0A0A9EZK5_ARUDO